MKPVSHLLRSIYKPFLILAPFVLLLPPGADRYRQIGVLSEPAEILLTGLAGFWAARRYRPDQWRMEILSGVLAAALLALARGVAALYLGQPQVLPLENEVARAAVAGATGAFLARLLHQRVTL